MATLRADNDLLRAAEVAWRNAERLNRWRVRHAYHTPQEDIMERKLFNIVRPREGRDGKTFWDRHGILIVKEGRLSLHLTSIPAGEWDGWFQAYPREEGEAAQGRREASPAQRFQAPPAPDFDDVPF